MKPLLLPLAAWLLASCHAEAPATPTAPRSADNEAGRPTPYDTLHVAGDGVLHLQPISAATYRQTLHDSLFGSTDYEATLAADTGRVRRQDAHLLLQPAQGPAVTFRNQQEARQTPGETASYLLATRTYYYRGVVPGTHQWLVDIHEINYKFFGLREVHHAYYCLVDQRTGQRTTLVGFPAVSPDGRYLVCTASGLYRDQGLEGPSGLQLVQLGAGAPRPGWLRDPQHWGPDEARWAGPRTLRLAQARLLPDGHDAPPTYVELTLP